MNNKQGCNEDQLKAVSYIKYETKIVSGNIEHPSESDYFVRCYLEDDGTWDIDVYEGDERDNSYSKGYIASKEDALTYANTVINELKLKGSVAANLPIS